MNRIPYVNGLSNLPVALTQFIDEIPIGLIVLDLNRRVVILNRAMQALTGFAAAEAEGIPCSYVLRNSLCIRGCPLQQVEARSEPVCVEADIINRNRRRVPVRVTAAPLLDQAGKPAAYLESIEDLRLVSECGEDAAQSSILERLVGRSQEIRRVLNIIPVIAQTDSSVLITGETGTGKDFTAEAIHLASTRGRGPFIKINCGALPEALLESELFGHQKGAFTGAVENKQGRFRLAHNGTLYLTEIGDLPVNLQVKLLSFLDDKVLYPLGSTKGIHVDVRLIAATHRNLDRMVRDGTFREDLLFRLNVVRLHLPPIRKRGDDVKLFLDHFLHVFNLRFKKKVKGFDEHVQRVLYEYPYPGNVRELRNIVEYAVNFCDSSRVGLEHLPAYILEEEAYSGQDGAAEDPSSQPQKPVAPAEAAGTSLDWAERERSMIAEAILKARGRKSTAAKILGWGRSTLWRKMKRYGMGP
ncbi:MAG: sigma 54-interacting transcriptional regulator [Pseudomonadota bacterium]